MIKNRELLERFIRYAVIDTQSAEGSDTTPSTMKQHDLALLLYNELRDAGASDVFYDRDHCYVYACIPGDDTLPAIGFIAHMDTSDAVSDTGVKPRIIENYDGNDDILKPADFPELNAHIGEDLIATDGTTLLGADDKAGIAEIMELAHHYLSNPSKNHRTVRIAFTCDEEIGNGTAFFDLERFNAPAAYTVDGGKLGIIEYENFNAAGAHIDIHGKSVHPGDAKNIMVNASLLAMEFKSMLPPCETPEHTEMYEGFFHLTGMHGSVENASLDYIIRDHSGEKFEKRKETISEIAGFLNRKYGEGTFETVIEDQYFNMAPVMASHMDLIEDAIKAFRNAGVECRTLPIRGGTDGAMLTFKGLPCPNLCTGGYNYHGRYEYASIQEMEKTAEALIELVKI